MITHLLSFFILLILSSPMPSSSILCNKDDLQTLLTIKAHFGNPHQLSSWNPTTDCCDETWSGIFCDSNTGKVNAVALINTSLSGTFPSAIGDLTDVISLHVTNNPGLIGTIPYSLSKSKIITMILDHNSLSGPIPPFLSNMNNLNFLDISYNQFTGSIPPSLANLRNTLAVLILQHNRLTGTIPESFGTFQLQTLSLAQNKLSGPIPKSLGKGEFISLDLSANQLTGDASFLFDASKPNQYIRLAKNQLSFDLTHLSFPLKLKVLDLRKNMIFGSIPAQINEVSDLGMALLNEVTRFNVSYNQLCGKIPAGSVTARYDQYVYSHNKCLCGAPLPACK